MTLRSRILCALAAGPASPAALSRVLGVERDRVLEALLIDLAAGGVERPVRGVYRLPVPPTIADACELEVWPVPCVDGGIW